MASAIPSRTKTLNVLETLAIGTAGARCFCGRIFRAD